MMRRPPGRNFADEADDKRVDGAFARMRGGEPEEADAASAEPEEDELLAELEQALAQANDALARLKAIQQKEEAGMQPGGGSEGTASDTGSPSAQGMP